MTYARARLWLGITGVGSLVTLCTIALLVGLPAQLLSADPVFRTAQVYQLACVAAFFVLWLMPLDYLGGFLLPRKFGKSSDSFAKWFTGYLPAAIAQASLFILFGLSILVLSQTWGTVGGIIAVTSGVVACSALRKQWVLRRESTSDSSAKKLLDAIALIQSWEIFVPRTIVVNHQDVGFTGGIIGLGRTAKIIVPKTWLKFPTEQLATAIARRAMAINSGSYTRGLAIALVWNVCGFLLCAMLPGAGLTSVASLLTTICGFTLWSFVGLLTLPTASRNASLSIDQLLIKQGTPADLISDTAYEMDQLQDGEPERPALIETIFHPVPNVASRKGVHPVTGFEAWNVARTTLFFSWACLGFLSRSVHCNIGRPELWTMLPTD
ncbi:MAG: hypothetical protein AB8B55_14540 [Mariniblastus sp.]